MDATLRSMRADTKHSNPQNVYEKHLNPSDKLSSSKNMKQAQNLKYQSQLEERNFQLKGNLASHTVEMWNLQQDKSSSVKLVFTSPKDG